MRRIKRRRVAGSLILFTGFVLAIAASILIKTSHVNYWEYYSIHVNSRMLYPLVTRATTVATERSIYVKCMRYPHVETNYALMAASVFIR